MILLLKPNLCPRCAFETISRDARRCTHCQTRLLRPNDNFAALQREEILDFYVFFEDKGWVHSDHLLRDGTRPNDPISTLKKPAKDYGMKPMLPAPV